jgi:hypothetical protein
MPPEDLHSLLKSQLVEIANGMALPLDGSETKADIIDKIERRRRYSRRDMQAE